MWEKHLTCLVPSEEDGLFASVALTCFGNFSPSLSTNAQPFTSSLLTGA